MGGLHLLARSQVVTGNLGPETTNGPALYLSTIPGVATGWDRERGAVGPPRKGWAASLSIFDTDSKEQTCIVESAGYSTRSVSTLSAGSSGLSVIFTHQS